MSKWVVLCPECDKQFKIDAEEIPQVCPHCRFEGEFEIVDEDD